MGKELETLQLNAIAGFTKYHHKIWSGQYDNEDGAWVSDLGAYWDGRLNDAGVNLVLEQQHHKCLCFIVDDWILPISDCSWAYDWIPY